MQKILYCEMNRIFFSHCAVGSRSAVICGYIVNAISEPSAELLYMELLTCIDSLKNIYNLIW